MCTKNCKCKGKCGGKINYIKLKIIDFDYIDGDILCIGIKDDRGVVYRGSLEKEE